MVDGRDPASFRDPSGFVFRQDGRLFRQVNPSYGEDYALLMKSGLYPELVEKGLLLAHREVDLPAAGDAFKIIEPDRVELISYPYEWCFSQLKDAAMATLAIQKLALEHEMTLKDASAYNIQFHQGRPVLIDTLSFERYQEGKPWIAYGLFCQHFLAPLALVSYRDSRLGRLLRSNIDGIPLDLTSSLLPSRTRARLPLLMHLHLHARSQSRYADRPVDAAKAAKVSKQSQFALVDSLETGVEKLRWKPGKTEWSDYYDETNYAATAEKDKREIVESFIESVAPATVWDLGANVGPYSRLASGKGIFTAAFDIDPAAVDANYRRVRSDGETHLLPLVLDLTNPSPALGWAHAERSSLADRGPVDLVMALALVHHLAISNNVPLEQVAEFLSTLGRQLVIEFVPKGDSQVQRLLAMRQDIFPQYTREGFEAAFARHFQIEQREEVRDASRILYLMRRLR